MPFNRLVHALEFANGYHLNDSAHREMQKCMDQYLCMHVFSAYHKKELVCFIGDQNRTVFTDVFHQVFQQCACMFRPQQRVGFSARQSNETSCGLQYTTKQILDPLQKTCSQLDSFLAGSIACKSPASYWNCIVKYFEASSWRQTGIHQQDR